MTGERVSSGNDVTYNKVFIGSKASLLVLTKLDSDVSIIDRGRRARRRSARHGTRGCRGARSVPPCQMYLITVRQRMSETDRAELLTQVEALTKESCLVPLMDWQHEASEPSANP